VANRREPRLNCAACGAPSETGTGFCGACGHRFAEAAPIAAARAAPQASRDTSSIALCGSCGVLRAGRKQGCPHCKVAYGAALSHGRADDFWACVECSFRCRACGFRVPLNHLDMDGGVLCARCGLDQAFEVASWRDALTHAHAVTESVGIEAPWLDEVSHLGERQCSVTQTFNGANGFEVTSSPGFPLCPRCRAPVAVTTTEAGDTTVACAGCATTESYALPATARKMMHGALRGVIAAEHRAGHAQVRVEQTPGAIAIVCPSCSAPLPASADSKFLTCAYCKTVSRIPDRTWFQLNGQEPTSESLWLLFHGPSQTRTAFERSAQKHAHKVEARAQGEQERLARQHAERQSRDEDERRHADEQRRDEEAKAEAERQRVAKQQKSAGLRVGLWLGGVVLLSAGVLVVVLLSGGESAAPKAALADSHASAPSAIAPKPPVPDVVRVPSCACTSQTASGKDEFVLQEPTGGAAPWSFDWTHASGFVETESTIALAPAAPAVHPGVLPPKGADALRMGIACDGAVVAVVLGNRASAWSGNGNGPLWTTALPGTFAPAVHDAANPSPSAGSAVSAACAAPIPVEGGAIALALSGGKRVHLSLEDGRVK
jgi:hypothetical protein